MNKKFFSQLAFVVLALTIPFASLNAQNMLNRDTVTSGSLNGILKNASSGDTTNEAANVSLQNQSDSTSISTKVYDQNGNIIVDPSAIPVGTAMYDQNGNPTTKETYGTMNSGTGTTTPTTSTNTSGTTNVSNPSTSFYDQNGSIITNPESLPAGTQFYDQNGNASDSISSFDNRYLQRINNGNITTGTAQVSPDTNPAPNDAYSRGYYTNWLQWRTIEQLTQAQVAARKSLFIRSSAAMLDNNKIGYLKRGDQVTVTGISEDGNWCRIQYGNASEAYSYCYYLIPENS